MDKVSIYKQPIRTKFLNYNMPDIEDDEINEVVDTLKSGWITTGPKVQKFENLIKDFIGCKYAIATNSCSAALHLSLVANGINEGDEVITSPFTFAATANVILHQRAKPVFVDIEPDTFNIDSKKIEDVITDKTKAIMPVHFAGHPCNMDQIIEIADEYNLKVIEDAAHAIGAQYKKRKIGTLGDLTCFSFYATKNITTGEGGIVTTNNKELSEQIRLLSLHGISKDAWKRYSVTGDWFYQIMYPGYKYNMMDIQASIGIHQMKKIKKMQRRREEIANRYKEEFQKIPEIIIQDVKKYAYHSWHLFPIQINTNMIKINRDEFIEKLKENNIGVSVHFIPIHLHPYYKEQFGFKTGDFPISEKIYEQILSLPLYSRMSDKDVDDVIYSIEKILKFYK